MLPATPKLRAQPGFVWVQPGEVRPNHDFDKVIDKVKSLNAMDMEVCCTLGMITESQADRLKDAGLITTTWTQVKTITTK